jgi:hypothetical protein
MSLEVWDDDPLSDDLIGTGVVDLMDLAPHNKPQLARIYLEDGASRHASSMMQPALPDLDGAMKGGLAGIPLLGQKSEQKKSAIIHMGSDTTGTCEQDDQEGRPYLMVLLRWVGTVPENNSIVFRVWVLRGREMLQCDDNGHSDPYCELRLEGFQSAVCTPIEEEKRENWLHHGAGMARDAIVGHGEKRENWLHHTAGRARDAMIGHQSDRSTVHNPKKLGKGCVARTSTKYKTLNPEWGEGFKFELEATPEEMAEMSTNVKVGMQVVVKDRDVVSFDDMIGTRFLTLEDIRRTTSPADSGVPDPDDIIGRVERLPPNEDAGIDPNHVSGEGVVQFELRDAKGKCCADPRGFITLRIAWSGISIPELAAEDSMGGAIGTFLERIPDRKEDEHRFIARTVEDPRVAHLFNGS